MAGGGEVEEFGAVDLGVGGPFAGFGGPFEADRIALAVDGVAVALEGPGVDDLAGFLADLAEGVEGGCRIEVEFFFELALGGGEEVFAFFDFSLGDGPGAEVFFGPEGAAGVDEQDLECAVVVAVHEEAGAGAGHRGGL